MSPRPDRRSDSRPERGARRPGGASSGRPPSRGAGRPGAPQRPGRSPRSSWGGGEGAGSDRGRPGRDATRPTGEWTPRDRAGDSSGPRRGDAPRFADRRPERSEFGRSEERRPEERRWERRPERGARFERRTEAGRPPRPAGPRPVGPRSTGVRPGPPRLADGPGGARFVPRGGSRPRPPAELIGLERRAPAGLPAQGPEGEHFAGAAPSDLIWGRHSAQATLESGRPIHRIWCTSEMRFSPRFLQLLREAKASGVLVEEVTWARLGQISGGAVHQGIVLQPAAAETLDLASLIEGCRGTGESSLLIAVDGLTDPQNLGAIVRSAEALGAHGLVLPQRRNAGLTGSVAKVAAGALEHLPVARVVNLNRSLETLKDEGYRVIGLASEGSVTLEEVDLDGPLVVVTGSEGDGLSLLTRRHCDQLVRIPLRGTTPSLNASVATALLLYEIARRGWMQGLRGNSPAPRLVRPALPAPAAVAETVGAETEAAETVVPEMVAAESPLPASTVPDPQDPDATAGMPVEALDPLAAPVENGPPGHEAPALQPDAAAESTSGESDPADAATSSWHATIASEAAVVPLPEPQAIPEPANSWLSGPGSEPEGQHPTSPQRSAPWPGDPGMGRDPDMATSDLACGGPLDVRPSVDTPEAERVKAGAETGEFRVTESQPDLSFEGDIRL